MEDISVVKNKEERSTGILEGSVEKGIY